MSSKLLQLSLYVVTVIQLTSLVSAHDVIVIQKENDVNLCGNTDEMLVQLITAVSESLTHDVSSREHSERMFSQLMSGLSQLKLSDVNSSSCERIEHVLTQLMTAVSQLRLGGLSGTGNCSRADQVLNQLLTAVTQQNNSCCGHTDRMLNQLTTAVSQLQNSVSQMQLHGVNTNCSRTDQVPNQLITAVSQLQTTISQLQTTVSQLQSSNSQLQRDIAKIKAAVGKKQLLCLFLVLFFCVCAFVTFIRPPVTVVREDL